uniref:Uncharacterized protein n=1 Tax=Aegilops tauschii subsp. strangulata TaxID=200361 RepID=A0A453KTN2_AEGTS
NGGEILVLVCSFVVFGLPPVFTPMYFHELLLF